MRDSRPHTHRRKRGFTLLELIVVITIIGLLGTLVVTKVVPVLFHANRTKIQTDIKGIVHAARAYMAQAGHYPESLEELINPEDDNGNPLPGLEETPLDPWGEPYTYELRDDSPVAICLGKDQTEGGEGDDQDHEYPNPEDDL